eukprot:5338632-Alexandrium_andersonii.AAC.1
MCARSWKHLSPHERRPTLLCSRRSNLALGLRGRHFRYIRGTYSGSSPASPLGDSRPLNAKATCASAVRKRSAQAKPANKMRKLSVQCRYARGDEAKHVVAVSVLHCWVALLSLQQSVRAKCAH